MVMAREQYSLLINIPFHLPTNPGAAAIYARTVVTGQLVNNTPLSRTEQASIDTLFNQRKHYFLSMQNIKRVCFTALDAIINDASKVSHDPTVQGWQAGIRVINILDQLSLIYGQPTPAALEANDHIFRSPASAADAPEVFSAAWKNAPRKRCSDKIPTPTRSASSSPRVYISVRSKIGTNWPMQRRRGLNSAG
jgi:hypothetical protein